MKKMLVVEDDALVQELMGKIAERNRYSLVVAGSRDRVEDALENIQSIDFAIVDLIMPFVTGWDVIDRIRAAGGKAATMPIIVLTGASVSDEEKNRLLKKVNAVVWKGNFTYANFISVVKSLVPD